jgi:anaphase-promoting complex subunit 2
VHDGTLATTVKLLRAIQNIYFHRIEQAIPSQAKTKAQSELARFRDKYHALVANSLSTTKLSEHLSVFLQAQARNLFSQPMTTDPKEAMEIDNHDNGDMPLANIKQVLLALDDVGLGGAQVQRVLAEVVDEGLTTFVANEYSEVGTDDQSNAEKLRCWVDDCLFPLVRDAVTCLRTGDQCTGLSWDQQLPGEITSWKERATHELAALRLEKAFKIVVEWQDNMPNGLNDLAPYTKTMAGRAFIINKFSASVGQRLLHPGASTIEILQVYVHIIMAFLELDPKGVLLDRISRPLRRYLRERPDTVKTIIQGLLLEVSSDQGSEDPMEELARVLNDLQERQMPEDDMDEDLYDLRWEPDPIDAAPEYKADERGEILGSLIDIFENKDIFIKEFQNMLGDSLLQNEHDFHREIQVLELFKKRIGESQLQACEVMLKDINDSRRIDDHVKKDQEMSQGGPQLKAKVLSRFYWPSLQPEDFKIPETIKSLQDKYSLGFEQFKNSRKLTWLNSLGRAKVELQLKDRVIEEEVHTWQASVIYAFADLRSNGGAPATKSAKEIEEELQMDEDLVQAALSFWVGKMVLRWDGTRYSVLEELLPGATAAAQSGRHTEDGLEASAAAASASAAAADVGGIRRNEEKVAEEKMAVFWQFIQNMLRNQGAMSLPKIVMMLKFAVQGGFPYTNDELKAFLAKKVEAGQLDLAGGKYKTVGN